MKRKIFIFHLNFFFIIIIISDLSYIQNEITFINPTSIDLLNGNLFIIHKYGIDICDTLLTKIINTPLTFSEEDQIATTYNLSKVIITKFDDGYVICLINDKIYIFDNEGKFLYHSERIDNGKNPDYYSLNTKDNYHFYIAFISDNLLNLYYYEYKISENITNLIASHEDFKAILNAFNRFPLRNKGVSCHYMINTDLGETLACFYILFNQNTEQDTFAIGFYKIDRNYINEESMLNYWPASQDCWNIDFLKVDINSERSKALVCLILSNGKNNCFIYNIYASGFNMDYLDCNNKICRNEYYGLKINYYSFKDEFIFSCLGEIGNITYCIFNNKFDYNEINQFEKCDKINGYSTLFSNLTNKYYIISDEVCNNKIIPHHHLNETIKVIEEEEREEEEKEEEEEEIKNENEVEEEVTEEIIDYKCKLKKCEICDKNSEKKNLCKKCNLSDKY